MQLNTVVLPAPLGPIKAVISPWRAANVMRYIAAAEVATNEFFTPIVPEELAERLRLIV